jgi:hypothetical protein
MIYIKYTSDSEYNITYHNNGIITLKVFGRFYFSVGLLSLLWGYIVRFVR